MNDIHLAFKVREADVHEFRKIGIFQHAIMKDDPLFQMKFNNVDFEDWLQYKWLEKRQDAVLKGDAAIFVAGNADHGDILGVVGYLEIKTQKLETPSNQRIPGGVDLKKILDPKEAYADAWHKKMTDSEGDFLRESSVTWAIAALA